LNLRDNFLDRRNILATNQIARKTIEPFENNNKRSQGRLVEGGPLTKVDRKQICIKLTFILFEEVLKSSELLL